MVIADPSTQNSEGT